MCLCSTQSSVMCTHISSSSFSALIQQYDMKGKLYVIHNHDDDDDENSTARQHTDLNHKKFILSNDNDGNGGGNDNSRLKTRHSIDLQATGFLNRPYC